MRRSLLSAVVLVLFALAALPASAAPSGTVNVQILGVNDFHGNLEPPTGSSGRILTAAGNVDAGGAEYLATHIRALKATNPNTVVVSAGDLIGASPLLSALFHDEPTIEAFNQIGLDFNAVGNHEFDEGSAELLRMQNGGCHPVDGCQDGDGFGGANFQFLAANVVRNNGKTLFPAYKIRSFGGAKIAFIGLTLKGTPLIVTPSGVAGLKFNDEAETINNLVPQIKAQGVKTIVVLIHEGGAQTGLYNDCVGISGAIVGIVNKLDPEVDAVLSGHTHNSYNCMIPNKSGKNILVTSAASFGRLITKVDLTIDRGTGNVVAEQAANKIVTRDVAKAADVTTLIGKYNTLVAPLKNKVIGSITADITRATTTGETALGDVIADAQLASTSPAGFGSAVVAFMNPGGIRADLTYSASAGGEAPGEITYNEAFTVQPFANTLVTKTMTGAQIEALLEQQWCGSNLNAVKILQVSSSFSYTYDGAGISAGKNTTSDCDRVDPASIKINGLVVDPNTSYRITMNNFLATGGDGFTVFKDGTNDLGGAVDIDSFVDYFGKNSPVAPPALNRITFLP